MLGVLVATDAVPAGWANVVATAAGTVPSFELNRRWVWRQTGRRSVLAEVGPVLGAVVRRARALDAGGHASPRDGPTANGFASALRTLTVEGANVAPFGSLWLLQFVILDRLLFASRRGGAHAADGRSATGRAPESLRAA